MAITFRDLKGSALTHPEMDTNLASYYLSSSVSGSTITFFQSGSDGLVISSSQTLADATGSDYIAGLGLDLDTGSREFSIQNANGLGDNRLTKWDDTLGQITDSIIYNSGSEAVVDGKLSVIGDIFQSGSKVELNVAWPPTGSETHLLRTDGYVLNGKPYEYSAIAMDHFEEFPGYFHNSFRIYTQDSPAFNYGSYLNIGPIRTGMFLKPSGSAELANVSIQDREDGTSLALLYATEIQIGAFNGEILQIGNAQSANTIEGLQTEISGSVIVSGSVTADSLITRGGTSSQFVKGDGSLDSNTYLTSSIDTQYTASGSGLILSGTVFTNTLPDQVVTLAGQSIIVNGTYPDFQITGSDTSDFALLSGDNIFSGTNNTFENITVNGTGSFNYIESITGSAKIIGDAFVVVNSNSPAQRYSGLATFDSGSLNVTASFFFDSTLNDWNYQYDSASVVDFGVAMFGPEYTVQGSPVYNTANRLVKADGGHHLLDSNISDNGTTVSILTNVEVTGTISGSTYYGDGSNLTGIAGTTYTAGTGLSLVGTTFNNTAPDQTVSLTQGGATVITGTYPNFTISSTDTNTTYTAGTGLSLVGTTFNNTAPDQTVAITGQNITVNGTYPNFQLTGSTDTIYSAGIGLSLVGTTFNNTAPDQTVTLTQGGATVITGTYPNFTISSTDTDTTYTNVSEFVNDAGYITFYNETDTLQSVTTRGATTSTTITAANFITTSDKRLKSDIKPIQEGLETIKKFVSYEYVKDGVQDAGFLAQEVQEAIPYSIGEREDGFLTMRDRPVLAHMHKAILELEARLAAIEEKLN